MTLRFEWDDSKANRNLRKHGVDFEEAASVFFDFLAFIFDDEWHSHEEEREIIIRHSTNNRLLLVSFTERDGTIRILSARQATPKERQDYEDNADFGR